MVNLLYSNVGNTNKGKGMSVQYNRDLIAERDSRDKLHNSIVKWWQVNYTNPAEEVIEAEPEEPALSEQEQEELRLAEEIFARLNAEKAADDAILQAQIEQAYKEAAAAEANDYNATTGAYSGAYGKNSHLDTEKKSQVDSIMAEKDAALRALISGAQI